MEFQFESWTVEKLLDLYSGGNLNLNPPYQRNPIWGPSVQKGLIKSIKQHSALPTFFLYEKEPGKYEVVDGQQRTRTLLSYRNTNDLDEKKGSTDSFKSSGFLEYPLNITLITELGPADRIEEFYARINSSGNALNRPETFKARFFETKMLDFVEGLVARQDFSNLDLVPAGSKKRMLDRDLVEELVAQSLYGITDKKEQVDKIYDKDLNEDEEEKALEDFDFAMSVLELLNRIKPIKNTRYRQRNDFYTLFGYIINNKNISTDTYKRFYSNLLALEPGIRPDKLGCPPLADYAFNCVSQSNSQKAREERLKLLGNLLGQVGESPTVAQKQVKEFYSVPDSGIESLEGRVVFVPNVLKTAINKVELKS